MVLPSISSSLRIGVIISCSMVPRCTLADHAERREHEATAVMMNPTRPGIMKVVEPNDGW